MARRKRMSEGKKNIIAALLKAEDIKRMEEAVKAIQVAVLDK